MVTKKLVSSKKPSPTKKASPTTKVTPEKLGLNVGVIGLGIMGSSIATNLHRAGFQVFGFDPSPKQQKLLKRIGVPVTSDMTKGTASQIISKYYEANPRPAWLDNKIKYSRSKW